MHVVLWDTQGRSVLKHDLGGWESWRGPTNWPQRLLGGMRPTALRWAYLAAVLRRLGHSVEFAVDYFPPTGKLFVFHPSLMTLHSERRAMRQIMAVAPKAQILLTGPVAGAWPEAFADLPVKIIKGDPEQLLWKLDAVLRCESKIVNLGPVDDLDTLPWPDWAPFQYEEFRMRREFRSLRVGLIHLSRTDARTTRFRAPERVVSELRHLVLACGCQAFRFCDSHFGTDPQRAFRLAELFAQLPVRVPFAVQTRAEAMPFDLLRVLRSVGLCSVRLDVEESQANDPAQVERLGEFVAQCDGLSIRTQVRLQLDRLNDPVSVHVDRQALARINATLVDVDISPECLQTELLQPLRQSHSEIQDAEACALNVRVEVQHRRLARAARGILAGYQRRWRYWRRQAAVRWPSLKRLAWRHADLPTTDVPHHQTPKPLGGLLHIRGASLRKDSPHKRTSGRRKPST